MKEDRKDDDVKLSIRRRRFVKNEGERGKNVEAAYGVPSFNVINNKKNDIFICRSANFKFYSRFTPELVFWHFFHIISL